MQKKNAPAEADAFEVREAERRLVLVLFLVFAGVSQGLFALFFHLLARLFDALGAALGRLFLLGFERLFGSEELDESGLGAIALLPSVTDDAQVTAFAVAEARRDIEQL